MVDSRKLEVAVLLAPLPAVVALGWWDVPALEQVIRLQPVISLGLLALTAFTLAFGTIRLRPVLDRRSFGSGALIVLVSMGLYSVGSYFSSPGVQWISLTMVYLGSVLFLGGKGYLLPVSVASISAAAFAAPLIFGYTAGYVLQGVGIISLSLYILALGLYGTAQKPECPYCSSYLARRDEYCSFCGRSLSDHAARIPRSKAWKWGAVSVFLVAISAVSLPLVIVDGTGIAYAHAGFGGSQTSTPLPLGPGLVLFNSSQLILGPGVEVRSYSLGHNGSPVGVWIVTTLSRPDNTALSKALPGLRAIGQFTVTRNESLTEYQWTEGSLAYVGFSNATTIRALANGSLSTLFLTTFAGELRRTTTSTSSQGAYALSELALVSARLADAQTHVSEFQFLAALLSIYTPYIEVGAVVATFAWIFVAVRERELSSMRRIENTWGLSTSETLLLSSMSDVNGLKTGYELLEKAEERSGTIGWNAFLKLLERFSALGLIETTVRVRAGIPQLYWKCTVT
ncbi:MAG: hypothetical protein OK452_06415 [Thaumarchaeota archaeon]|nr:hypothetical protein [Nitrososphaerota archaeon]